MPRKIQMKEDQKLINENRAIEKMGHGWIEKWALEKQGEQTY